eukprot:SAG31_NODE_716_length_12626_cov_7.493973_9_plen_287_part_00
MVVAAARDEPANREPYAAPVEPPFKCDQGCLQYKEDPQCNSTYCIITSPKAQWECLDNPCTMTFENDLVLKQNSILQPSSAAVDTQFVLNTTRSISLFNASRITAPYIRILASRVVMHGSSILNATAVPSLQTPIPEERMTLEVYVQRHPFVRSVTAVELHDKSEITGARINITTTGDGGEPTTINVTKDACINASNKIKQFHDSSLTHAAFDTCPSPPQDYKGGGGYGGTGSDCRTGSDPESRAEGQACGSINGTCRDGEECYILSRFCGTFPAEFPITFTFLWD